MFHLADLVIFPDEAFIVKFWADALLLLETKVPAKIAITVTMITKFRYFI